MPRLSLPVRSFLALCAALFALAFAAPASADEYSTSDYRLGSGDRVKVTVYGEADLSGDFDVDATGMVRLPLAGTVKAGGLTAHDLEGSITTALANGYLTEPRVSVEVSVYRPFYVVGEVLKPGQYPYVNGMTAASAIALAGGYTNKAIQSVVFVRHQGESSEERIASNDNSLIRPGDVVRINSSTFWDIIDVLSPLAGVSSLRYVY